MAYIDNPSRSRPGIPTGNDGPTGRIRSPGRETARPPRAAPRRPVGRSHDDSPDWQLVGTFAGGIALGAILGAGVAFLLAPHTGAETREMIAGGARNLGGRAHDVWDDLRDELSWATHRGRRRIGRAAMRGRWAAEDLWDRERHRR